MDLNTLVERLKRAYSPTSLRKLAAQLEVSHELLRKLLLSKNRPNLTLATYDKIDKGLKDHGF